MVYSYLVLVALLSCLIEFSATEWVEIPQIGEKKNYKVAGSSSSPSFSGLLKPVDDEQLSTPSQAWLEYQIERFGQHSKPSSQSSVVKNVNKVVVTDRIGYPNQSEPHRLRPRPGYDEGPGYDIDININKKQTLSGQTVLLNNRKKFTVTASNSEPIDDKYEEAVVTDEADEEVHRVPEPKPPSSVTEDTKLSSFQKIVNFFKMVQSSFVFNAKTTIEEKVKYLHWLKNRLLFQIEDRLNSLWSEDAQDNDKKTHKDHRSKRDLYADDSFMAFPSTEAALMTINFLTFAVFLIKLVLQVIKTLKSKHYSYNGFTVNTMEGIKLAKSRKKRGYHDDAEFDMNIKAAKILNSIHNYGEKIKSAV